LSNVVDARTAPPAAQAASAAELLAALDSLPAMVSVWTADRRNVFANAALASWYGQDRSELVGSHVRDLLGEESYQLNEPIVVAALNGQFQSYERSVIDASGTMRHVHGFCVPFRTDGVVDGWVNVTVDVSARVDAQLALRAQYEQAALLGRRRVSALAHHADAMAMLTALSAQLRELLDGPELDPADLDEASHSVADVVAELRAAIGELREFVTEAELLAGVRAVLAQSTPALGFEPRLRVRGQFWRVPGELLVEVLAVLAQALDNTVRHASASRVDVDLISDAGEILVRISDDGVGVSGPVAVSGLALLRGSAQRLGGAFACYAQQPHGTVLEWRAPTSANAASDPSFQPLPMPRSPARAEPAPASAPEANPLLYSREFLVTVLDAVPSTVILFDIDYNVVFANSAGRNWLDLTSQRLADRPNARDIAGSAMWAANRPFADAALRGCPQSFERIASDRHGQLRHFQVSYRPRTVGGRIVGFGSFVSAITATLPAQESLRVQLERTRAQEDSQRQAVLVQDGVIQHLYSAQLGLAVSQTKDARARRAALTSCLDEVADGLARLERVEAVLHTDPVTPDLLTLLHRMVRLARNRHATQPELVLSGRIRAVPPAVATQLGEVLHAIFSALHTSVKPSVAMSVDHDQLVLGVEVDGVEGPELSGAIEAATELFAQLGGRLVSHERTAAGEQCVVWSIPLSLSPTRP
jgi:PAS domain S-box-containing protein